MAKKRKKPKTSARPAPQAKPAPSEEPQRPLAEMSEMERMQARFGVSKKPPPPPPAPEPEPYPPAYDQPYDQPYEPYDQPYDAPEEQEAPADRPREGQPKKRKKRRLPWQSKKPPSTEQIEKATQVRPKRQRKSRMARLFDTSMRKHPPRERRAIKRGRRRRADNLYKIFTILFTIWCIVTSISQFFTVEDIRVEGVSRYPVSEIEQAFAVHTGDSLFFCNTSQAVDDLMADYPYFSEVKVTRELPQTLVLTITEATPAAAVPYSDTSWYLVDEQTRVLEKTKHIEGADLPIISGMRAPATAILGEPLPADDDGKIEILRTLLDTLKEEDLISRVRRVNLNSAFDICFEVDYRIAVRVGDGSDLVHKLRWIPVLLDGRVGATDKARFDLTDATRVSVVLLTEEELDNLLEEPAKNENSVVVTPNMLMGLEAPPVHGEITGEDGELNDPNTEGSTAEDGQIEQE